MSSYVESNLLNGEEIIYRARLSLIIFGSFFFVAGIGLLVLLLTKYAGGGLAIVAFAMLLAIPQLIALKTSEFAVTNRRVLIKVGWLSRRSLELLLAKVESISVDQDLMGRMFDYGTIGVRGTGGTRESFSNIANPFEFRRQVQALTDDPPIPIQRAAAAPIEETKKCPHCISDIPAAAAVCRYCARDVVSPKTQGSSGHQLSSCNHIWGEGDSGRECKRCGALAPA